MRYIQNERVDYDYLQSNSHVVWYKPLPYRIDKIEGLICWEGNKRAGIHSGRHGLLVDCDEVNTGYYDIESRRIALVWRKYPERHFLLISGEIVNQPKFV